MLDVGGMRPSQFVGQVAPFEVDLPRCAATGLAVVRDTHVEHAVAGCDAFKFRDALLLGDV